MLAGLEASVVLRCVRPGFDDCTDGMVDMITCDEPWCQQSSSIVAEAGAGVSSVYGVTTIEGVLGSGVQ